MAGSKLERLTAAVNKAKDVRDAQRQYFKTRDRDDLARSKALERELDKLIPEALREDDLLEVSSKVTMNVQELGGADELEGVEIDVLDALASVPGAIVVGGGVRKATVRSDGQVWRIVKFLEVPRG